MTTFQKDLENLINRHSQENGSNTPDFLLAEYLNDCLAAFGRAVNAREKWYGRMKEGNLNMANELHLGPAPESAHE